MQSHDQHIIENYLKYSANDIAKKISKSPTYVRNRYKKLGLVIHPEVTSEFRARKGLLRTKYTPQDDSYLRDNYLKTPVKIIAKYLGHSSYATFNRLKKLGLEVPVEIALSRKRNTQFKKGHVPQNKGKTAAAWMSPQQLKNFTATQYKKGNEPYNTLSDGVTRQRADKSGKEYIYIRVKKGRWELLQREVYRKEIGPLEDHEIVRFKDGNTSNCSPANLEKLTKSENMLRNTVHRHGPELAKAQFLLKKIERKIITNSNK